MEIIVRKTSYATLYTLIKNFNFNTTCVRQRQKITASNPLEE